MFRHRRQAILQVVCGGYNVDGQCDMPAGVYNPVSMAAGRFHSLALLGDGTVAALGKKCLWSNQCADWGSERHCHRGWKRPQPGGKKQQMVIAWGKNWDGQTNVPSSATNVIAVALRLGA